MRRSAFTLPEMIVVILLLGILGSMGSDIIVRTYENYVLQNEMARLQSRSKLGVDLLTGYLERSIKPSVSRYNGTRHEGVWGAGVCDANLSSGHYLAWIDKDLESLRGSWSETDSWNRPGYSALADMRKSGGADIVTGDCDPGIAETIQEDITGSVWISGRSALYFPYANSSGSIEERFWSAPPSSLFPVDSLGPGIVLANRPAEMGERYYLSYTAYALQLEDNGKMYLYWNFRPWNGENMMSGTKHLMLENVVSFRFWGESEDTLLRFQLCLAGDWDTYLSGRGSCFCKEGALLR